MAKEKPNFESVLDYFQWFSMIFQMILVSLGETVLRFLAIPCLNNPHDETKNWFYDEYTPFGICPDGFASPASKNPLGRQTPTSKKPWTTELIKTVSDMAKYLESDEDLKNGYHLADILMHTCFMFGEETVFSNFASLVNMRKRPVMRSNRIEILMCVEQLEDDYQAFKFFKVKAELFQSVKLDLKRLFYRGCTLFVSALGRWFGKESSSCTEILDELTGKNLLLKEDCHKLKFAVAVCCEIRLRFYLRSNSQSDHVFQTNFLPQQPEARYLADAIGKSSFLDALANVVMLQGSLLRFVRESTFERSFYLLPEFLIIRPCICNWLKLYSDGVELCRNISQNQLDLPFSQRKCLFILYLDALKGCLRFVEIVRIIKLNLTLIKKHYFLDLLMYCYKTLGWSFYAMCDGNRALKFFRKLNFILYFNLCSGTFSDESDICWSDCYKCLGRYTKAMKYIDKELNSSNRKVLICTIQNFSWPLRAKDFVYYV